MTITTKSAPLSVLINWSESRELQTGEVYPFLDFEAKALSIAKQNPLGGYDKTNITVTFDNGDEHQCRLDLGGTGNEIGFADHCLSILHYHQLHKDDSDKPWMREAHQIELITLIMTYQLDLVWVTQARQDISEVTRQAKAHEEAKKQHAIQQRQAKTEEHARQEQAFQASLTIPDWAKAVIVATFTTPDAQRSTPCIGEYESHTEQTLILSWSKHTRNLFPELRKACLHHPNTAFLHDKKSSTEHRENYSMGAGTYLTDVAFHWHGWKVRKQVFWNDTQKEKYVPLGELALPQD